MLRWATERVLLAETEDYLGHKSNQREQITITTLQSSYFHDCNSFFFSVNTVQFFTG